MADDYRYTKDKPLVSAAGRVSYPHVFRPTVFKDPRTGEEGKPRFETTLIFSKEDCAGNLQSGQGRRG